MRIPSAAKPVSKDTISKSVDSAMDEAIPSRKGVAPGISIRNGPVEEMDIDEPEVNGNPAGKRKSRQSLTNGKSYNEMSSDEDDEPLVRLIVSVYRFDHVD